MKKLLLACSFLALFSGCASTKMASPEADAGAKQFQSSPDKAKLYVYRNEVIGSAIKMDVSVDNQKLGATVAKTYFMTDVEPGRHTIKGEAENDSVLTLDMLAGKIYYVWQEVKMGVLYARNKLQSVDEATGKAGVLQSKLAQTQTAP